MGNTTSLISDSDNFSVTMVYHHVSVDHEQSLFLLGDSEQKERASERGNVETWKRDARMCLITSRSLACSFRSTIPEWK